MTDDRDDAEPPQDPRRDRRYLSALIALMVVVFTFALVSIAGEMVFESDLMREVGFTIVILAGLTYFGLRIYGNLRGREYDREMRRRALARDFAEDRHAEPDEDEDEQERKPDEDRAGRDRRDG